LPPIARRSSRRRSSDKPHAILAVSALVAPTEAEARFLPGSQALSWAPVPFGRAARARSARNSCRA
jgi:hypothetical protein